jgi:hypothetical protein
LWPSRDGFAAGFTVKAGDQMERAGEGKRRA